jgi:hypothetical protein
MPMSEEKLVGDDSQFDICARRFKRMHACPRVEGSKKCNTVSRVRQTTPYIRSHAKGESLAK